MLVGVHGGAVDAPRVETWMRRSHARVVRGVKKLVRGAHRCDRAVSAARLRAPPRPAEMHQRVVPGEQRQHAPDRR